MTPGKSIESVLEGLSRSDDGVVAVLADALMFAAHEPDVTPDSKAARDIRERIAALAGQLAGTPGGSATIVDAMVRIDDHLFETGVIHRPFAVRFAYLACECAVNAALEDRRDATMIELADQAPVVRLDDKTLVAAPTGELSKEALVHISDRISARVLTEPVKKVILILAGLSPSLEQDPCWQVLAEELRSMRVKLEIKGREKRG